MSIYDDMLKENSDGYEAAYVSCNESWKKINKERGLRRKIGVYDDAALIDKDRYCKYDWDGIDGLIKHWKEELSNYPLVDYAEMVGAPSGYYGISYVYEDPEPYYVESTIKSLEELKDLRKLINETITNIENNNNKLLDLIKMTNTGLKEE